MFQKLLVLIFLFISSVLYADSSYFRGKTIVGIEDEKGYPPFIYINQETGEYDGYSVDLLNLIFEDSGAEIIYNLLPWKRGLSYVKRGDNADIALVAASTEERRQQFLFSQAIAEVHLAYFYDKRVYPNGLGIDKPEDFLKIGSIRGMRGYEYGHYGIPKKVEQNAGTFQQLVTQLLNRRCDVILVRYEVFNSFHRVYPDFTGLENIEGRVIPWRKDDPIKFYFLSARDSEFHSKLIDYINQRIVVFEQNGVLYSLKQKHGLLIE